MNDYSSFFSPYLFSFADFGNNGGFDMRAIQHARKNNQRAKAQKRRRM